MSSEEAKPGRVCSFYFQGWRVGEIQYAPVKGEHKGCARVQTKCNGKLYWVPLVDINEVGDTTYHGPKAQEVYAERQEVKKKEQAKVDKKKAARRVFHR